MDSSREREDRVWLTASASLVGQSGAHLCSPRDAESLGARMHRDAVDAFVQLRAEARAAGFDLAVLSGFRSFDQQLSIWNRNATSLGRAALATGA